MASFDCTVVAGWLVVDAGRRQRNYIVSRNAISTRRRVNAKRVDAFVSLDALLNEPCRYRLSCSTNETTENLLEKKQEQPRVAVGPGNA